MTNPGATFLIHAAIRLGPLCLCLLAGCQHFAALTPTWSFPKQSSVAQLATKAPRTPAEPELSKKQKAAAKFALARTVEREQDLEQSAGAYESIIKTDPNHAGAHHRLAIICDKQGKPQEAEQHFCTALQHDAKNAELRCDYAYSLYVRGQLSEAESQLHQALTQCPRLPRANNNLGLIEARTGRLEQALESFQSAGCSSSAAHANAAFGLMVEGQWPGAQQELVTALALDPNSKLVRKQLDEVVAVMARTREVGDQVWPNAYVAPAAASEPIPMPPPAHDSTSNASPRVRPVGYAFSDGAR